MTADTFFDCIYHGPFPSSQRFCPECRALRATAAENTALRARVAQLEAALRDVLENPDSDWDDARAALAATPADAGRRWEAMRKAEAVLRDLQSSMIRCTAEIVRLSPPERLPAKWGELIDRECVLEPLLSFKRRVDEQVRATLDALARLDAEGRP